jgi:hypothetical protein
MHWLAHTATLQHKIEKPELNIGTSFENDHTRNQTWVVAATTRRPNH